MSLRRLLVPALLLTLTMASLPARGHGQAAHQTTETEALPPAEAARRDALLEPGLEELKSGDPAAAYRALQPVAAAFPDDLRTLLATAQAAILSQHNQEAILLFDRALAQHPAQPWPIRLGRMQAEARQGDWTAFDRQLAELRTAKQAGSDPGLAHSDGFVIDQFQSPRGTVQAVFFPLRAGEDHTLYRFLLPKGAAETHAQASVTTPGDAGHCDDPKFQPYIDLESDDVDQTDFKRVHPELAAKGDREYSLDTYPTPCGQGLIRFFAGEPSYETVRALVLNPVSAKKTAP